MKQFKKYLLVIFCVAGAASGSALGLKANIGVAAWDALAATIANIVDIKIGSMGIILNSSCIIGELIVLKKEFKIEHYFQIVLVLVLGVVVNFMLYDVYTFTVSKYWQRLILSVTSYVIASFFVAAVMNINLVTFSLEGFLMTLKKYTKIPFSTLRQFIDILSVIVCILLFIIFKGNLIVREGTIIGMFLFGPLLGLFMKLQKPFLIKYKFIND